MVMRKTNTSYSSWKNIKIPKEASKDVSKSIENKVGFTAVFVVITRKRALPEEAFIQNRNDSNKNDIEGNPQKGKTKDV